MNKIQRTRLKNCFTLIFISFGLICQVNVTTAFLWNFLNGFFGGGQLPMQPSLYAPINQSNPGNLNPLQLAQAQAQTQAQSWPTMNYYFPTTGIAGAFDNLARGIGGAAAGATLGVASLVAGVLQAFNNLLGVLGPGNYPYGSMIPQQNNTKQSASGDKSASGKDGDKSEEGG